VITSFADILLGYSTWAGVAVFGALMLISIFIQKNILSDVSPQALPYFILVYVFLVAGLFFRKQLAWVGKVVLISLIISMFRFLLLFFGLRLDFVTSKHKKSMIEVGRLRYKVYREKGYFGSESSSEGVHLDSFDDHQSVNVVIREMKYFSKERGRILGTLRIVFKHSDNEIIPAEKYFNLEDQLQGTDGVIAEMGRWVHDKRIRETSMGHNPIVKQAITTMSTLYLLEKGVSHFYVVCHKELIDMLNKTFVLNVSKLKEYPITNYHKENRKEYPGYFNRMVNVYRMDITLISILETMLLWVWNSVKLEKN
jgi:N-acyl-L-homoserine lactone synthetase